MELAEAAQAEAVAPLKTEVAAMQAALEQLQETHQVEVCYQGVCKLRHCLKELCPDLLLMRRLKICGPQRKRG